MTDTPLLYNSRIIDTYLRLLRRSYQHVSIPDLLDHAGMKLHQTADPGHWFSQEQIDLFHDKLVELSGNPQIAREAGRYAASADALGILRQHLLGMLGPARAFALISRTASLVTRSALYTSRRLGARKVEVNVSPYPGVEEKAFQCINRLGWFETLVRLFDLEVEKIDHPQCLFRGDSACRYIISWERPPFCFWGAVRNASLPLLPLLLAALHHFTDIAPVSLLLGGGLAFSLLALRAAAEEKKGLREALGRIREDTDQALTRSSANYDNALLANEIGRAIGQETSMRDVLSRVVELLSERLDFGRVMVFLPDREQARLELKASCGFSEELLADAQNLEMGLDLRPPRGLLARTFLEGEAVLVGNVDAFRESFTPEGFNLIKELKAESFLFCPIRCGGSSLGVLAAERSRGERSLLQTDLHLVEGVAASIGIALRNAELLETMTEQLRQIRVKDEELARSRENLEKEVELRTAQLQEALQAAQAATRAKSEFLANMSHEIRTPLHGVLGLHELLLESGLNARQSQLARQMRGCAETLLRLITDVLDFSRIEANRMELEEIAFDLREMLHETEILFRPQAEGKGLSFVIEILPRVPVWIKGDPLRLRQVLTNIVGNAVKFTEKGGVRLSVAMQEAAPSSLRFVVQDTGIGMSPEQMESVFESFRQADGSTSRRYGGSGLGTTIAKNLLELMGGEIGCESTPGAGSTFWFTIPLRTATVSAGDAEERSRPEERQAAGGPGRILVVEDNPVNREILQLHLEAAGYAVSLAEDGRAALAVLQTAPVDLILMDLQMHGMDGYEATRRIRAGEGGGKTAALPIVALTANATVSCRQKCLDVGMNEMIIKPARQKDLLARVRFHLLPSGKETEPPPPPQARGDGSDPLAIEDALEEFGIRGPAFRELLGIFIRETEERLPRIEKALREGDMTAVSRLAHGLKGTAGMYFAHPLSRSADVLEQAAQASPRSEVDAAVGRVRLELGRVREAWQGWDPF